MRFERPVPFLPDTRADISRILAVISRSSWLSISLVAILLALAVWSLMRVRRTVAKQTSMLFLLNSVVVITALLLTVLALVLVNLLVEPAAELQAFFGVWCLPPPRITVFILLGACVLGAIGEILAARLKAA